MIYLITNDSNNYQVKVESEFTIFWKGKKVPYQKKYGDTVSLTSDVPSREVLIVIPHSEMPDLAYRAVVNGLEDVDTVMSANALQKYIQDQKTEWTNLAGNVANIVNGVNVLKAEIARLVDQGKTELQSEFEKSLTQASFEIKDLIKNATLQQTTLTQKNAELKTFFITADTTLSNGTKAIRAESEKLDKVKSLTENLIATFSQKIEQLKAIGISTEQIVNDSEIKLRNMKATQKAIEEVWNKCNKLTISVEN